MPTTARKVREVRNAFKKASDLEVKLPWSVRQEILADQFDSIEKMLGLPPGTIGAFRGGRYYNGASCRDAAYRKYGERHGTR